MGYHTTITYSFMLTGHMRYLVDGCFGLLKQRFRKNDCYTLEQLAGVVNSSAACNTAQLVQGSTLQWREWDKFLRQ